MKKLFALILAVVMICAMSVSVFAADETTTTTTTAHVVGTHGSANNPVSDGVNKDNFAVKDPNVKVDIQATVGNVENRYAVDIEYETMSFNVSGSNLVWNVNTLEYEFETGTDASSAAAATDAEFDVQVINYSDLAVGLTINCTDTYGDDYITVACAANGTHRLEDAIGYTTTSVKADGSDAMKKFTVTVTSTDWAAAATHYAEEFTKTTATAITIGTLSITVSMNAPAANP